MVVLKVFCISFDHRRTPLALRERLALNVADQQAMLASFRADFPEAEAVLLSTCNRTELYVARGSHEAPSQQTLLGRFAAHADEPLDRLTDQSAIYDQEAALRHLIRVASGLEAVVMGEAHVIGQVRRAYETSVAAGTVRSRLHGVFQSSLAAARRVRETLQSHDALRTVNPAIDQGSDEIDVAIRAISPRNALDSLNPLDTPDPGHHTRPRAGRILILGAGAVSERILKRILACDARSDRPARISVMSRSLDSARALVDRVVKASNQPEPNQEDQSTCRAEPWALLPEALLEADAVLTATSASTPILSGDEHNEILRRRAGRPLVVADLALPRDVDPRLSAIDGVTVIPLETLQARAAALAAQRSPISDSALQFIGEMIHDAAFRSLARARDRELAAFVKDLKAHLNRLAGDEAARTAGRLTAGDPSERSPEAIERELDQLTHRLINKLLHPALTAMRSHPDPKAVNDQGAPPPAFQTSALRRLFGLGDTSIEPMPGLDPDLTTDSMSRQTRRSLDELHSSDAAVRATEKAEIDPTVRTDPR